MSLNVFYEKFNDILRSPSSHCFRQRYVQLNGFLIIFRVKNSFDVIISYRSVIFNYKIPPPHSYDYFSFLCIKYNQCTLISVYAQKKHTLYKMHVIYHPKYTNHIS